MKVFKKLKKVFAIMMSVVTMACCIGAIQASAVTVKPGLAYELEVERVSSKKVALHINFTKNPGIQILSFMVYYDSKCTLIENSTEYTGIQMNQTPNATGKRAHYWFVSMSPIETDISITCYFNTSDSANNSHEFSTAIVACTTKNNVADVSEHDGIDVTIHTGQIYTLGDIDNNSKININDAQAVLDIASRKGTSSVSVSYANSILSTLRKKYPNMVCAETADADQNKTINQTDASLILTYYSNESAGNTNENTFIGSSFYKTITA